MGRIVSFNDVSGNFVVRQMIKDGMKLSYFNDANVAPLNITVIPRKEALLLLMDDKLPRIPSPSSLTQKQKAVLNVLCTLCKENNTPEQAEFCDCYETTPAYMYVCQDNVCTEILHEHQQSCNAFREDEADGAGSDTMDVEEVDDDALGQQASVNLRAALK
jgi:hypothetical protein